MTIPTRVAAAIAELEKKAAEQRSFATESRERVAKNLLDPTRGLDTAMRHLRSAASEEGMHWLYATAQDVLTRVTELRPNSSAEEMFIIVTTEMMMSSQQIDRGADDVEIARSNGKLSALKDLRWIFGL